MWWGFRYILYLFATVFVLNIVIQLVVGKPPPYKVRQIKTKMKEAENFVSSPSSDDARQTETFDDLFGLHALYFKWVGVSNMFLAMLTYLDYFTQKLVRGIYTDFVAPLLRL